MGVILLTGKHGDTHIMDEQFETFFMRQNMQNEDNQYKIKNFNSQEEAEEYVKSKGKPKPKPAPKQTKVKPNPQGGVPVDTKRKKPQEPALK